MKAQKWVVVRHFEGEPKDGDLEIQEEDLPELKTGDILVEAEWWSVDPYMRVMADNLQKGDIMVGEQTGIVTKSKNGEYPVGTRLVMCVGWRSHTVCNPSQLPPVNYCGEVFPAVRPAPDTADLPKSVTLGVLGMPGVTAYYGFLEICKPKAGETVLVNGAAGAVGSLVGQIAKIKGCKVIGSAGTDEKVKYLRDELGFDFAFNYKKIDVTDALKEGAPDGIDCFYDNVGGDTSTKVLANHMNKHGRMSICGCISRYNGDLTKPTTGPELYPIILFKQLSLNGFVIFKWYARYNEAFAAMLKWIKEGKLKYREHVTDGFENMYAAFRGLLKGDNIGKAVIKASHDNTKM